VRYPRLPLSHRGPFRPSGGRGRARRAVSRMAAGYHALVVLFLLGSLVAGCTADEDECSPTSAATEQVLSGLRSSAPTFYGDEIYWAVPDGLYRARLDGSSRERLLELTSDPDRMFPGRPLVDGQIVYWAEPSTGRIRSYDLEARIASTLVDGIASRYGPRDLQMDETSLYWIESGDGTVARVPREGGDVERWQTGDDLGPTDPIALRLYGSRLYVVSDKGRRIFQLDPNSGDVRTVVELASGFLSAIFAVDDDYLYYTSTLLSVDGAADSRLWRVRHDGGGQESLFEHDSQLLFVLYVDESDVFFSDESRILRTSKSTMETSTLIGCQSSPFFLHFADDWLYWTSFDDEAGGIRSNLWRVPR